METDISRSIPSLGNQNYIELINMNVLKDVNCEMDNINI